MESATSLILAAALCAQPLIAAETYTIDPEESEGAFIILNEPPNAAEFQEVPGTFEKFGGVIVVDDENLDASKVELVIDAASFDTGNEKRDAHLRNQDFFQVKEHPTMKFESTGITSATRGRADIDGNARKPGRVGF